MASISMKENLKYKRPRNRNQILKETTFENIQLKQIIKQLQKESLITKKQNHDLRKKRRELQLQLRFANFETLQ
jgi:hypothetical protein